MSRIGVNFTIKLNDFLSDEELESLSEGISNFVTMQKYKAGTYRLTSPEGVQFWTKHDPPMKDETKKLDKYEITEV